MTCPPIDLLRRFAEISAMVMETAAEYRENRRFPELF
jgi:hypothetical protein